MEQASARFAYFIFINVVTISHPIFTKLDYSRKVLFSMQPFLLATWETNIVLLPVYEDKKRFFVKVEVWVCVELVKLSEKKQELAKS